MTYGEVVVMNKMGELFVCVPLFVKGFDTSLDSQIRIKYPEIDIPQVKYSITFADETDRPVAWMFKHEDKLIGIITHQYFDEFENLGEL
jgi:hypothetical protein